MSSHRLVYEGVRNSCLMFQLRGEAPMTGACQPRNVRQRGG